MEEKVYWFAAYKSTHEQVLRYSKKESELNTEEKDLLTGQLIKDWENSPEEVRIRFLTAIGQLKQN